MKMAATKTKARGKVQEGLDSGFRKRQPATSEQRKKVWAEITGGDGEASKRDTCPVLRGSAWSTAHFQRLGLDALKTEIRKIKKTIEDARSETTRGIQALALAVAVLKKAAGHGRYEDELRVCDLNPDSVRRLLSRRQTAASAELMDACGERRKKRNRPSPRPLPETAAQILAEHAKVGWDVLLRGDVKEAMRIAREGLATYEEWKGVGRTIASLPELENAESSAEEVGSCSL